PVLVALLFFYGFTLLRRRFRLRPEEWALLLLPFLYITVLSFLPQTHHRYFLPAAALLACLSAAGLKEVLALRKGKWIALALVLISVGWQAPRLYRAEIGFTQDHRTEAFDFLQTSLPAGSKVMEDRRVYFSPHDDKSIVRRNVSPGDTLESLRAEGFTHLVVSSRMYGSFFKKSSRPKEDGAEDFEKIKKFYEDLFERGTLLKEWQMGGNQYLANPLRIYSIENPKPAGVAMP
ncbi:MAG: hypothetical protein ACKOAS_06315, partial [Verrucomicrobiota bacterium]